MRHFAAPPFGAVLTRVQTGALTLLVDADDVVARAFAIIDATPEVDDVRAAIANRFCAAMLQPLDGVDEGLASIRIAAGEIASRRLADALATFALSDDGNISIAAPAFARGVPPPLALTDQQAVPRAGSIRGWSWEADLAGTIAATDSLTVSIVRAADRIATPDAPPFVAACAALVFASADDDLHMRIDAIAAKIPERIAPVTLPPSSTPATTDVHIDGLDVLVTPGGRLVFAIIRNGALAIASAFQPATWFAGAPLKAFLDRELKAFPSAASLLAAMLTPDGIPAFTSCDATIHVDAVKLVDTVPVSMPLIMAATTLPIPLTPTEEVEALDRAIAAMMPEGSTAAYDVTISADDVPRLRVRAG